MLWLSGAAILAAVFQAVVSPVSAASSTCSAYMYSRAEDVQIKVASILGMHDADGDKCGTTYNAGALQSAIALHFAADLINGYNDTDSFIPGVRIGIEIYDDCNIKYLAASHAGALASQATSTTSCSANPNASSPDVPVAGVIGTMISDTTTTVAYILEPTFIPVLGPSATIPELSNKTKYPHFVRVVPSDFKQIQVIVQLAKHLKWSYIIGLATSDNYGRKGMAELMKLAKEQMICVSLIPDFDLFDESQMEKFVRTTLDKHMENIKGIIGIVYFGLNDPLARFLTFIKEKRNSWSSEDFKRTQKMYWLASDAVQATEVLAKTVFQLNTNILVVSPYLVNILSFKQYFIEFLKAPPAWVSGQWKLAISSVVQNIFGCKTYNFTEASMAACNIDEDLVFDSYIPSVLDAFFLLANTIKALHLEACNNMSGPCAAFSASLKSGLLKGHSLQNLDYASIKSEYFPPEFSLRKLQKISGDFEVVNQPLYTLQAMKMGSFVKVAEFKDDEIVATPELDGIFNSSECKAICKDCRSIGEISYLFHPGHVLFIGIFSIQWQSDQNPYKCDMYREASNSYIAMEAFINTVNQLKNFTGIDFGYLILDDCYNTLTLTKLLNGVMSGDITIQSPSGSKFNTSQVAVAIGAESSDVTLSALPILTELNIPMISYSATHPVLDNRIMYPYFSRTLSSDAVQSKAFVDILKYLKVTFVGAIVIKNTYGLELYTRFKQLAESEGICVDDAVNITNHVSDENFDHVIDVYRSKQIQVIVVIAMENTIKNLLNTVRPDDTFVFLASETWGPNYDILRGDGGKKARGCLVLGAAPVKLNYNIKKHLETLDPYANTSTVWLRDFWQDKFQCDMPGGFSNTHGGNICNKVLHNLSTIIDDLVNSPLAVHAEMAAMSAGLTVSNFFKSQKQMPFNPSEFTNALRSVKVMSSTGEIRPYNDKGNGDFGFEIFNVQSSTDNKERYVYVNVGSYSDKDGLNLNKSLIKFYDASGRVVDMVESSCMYIQQCNKVCGGAQANVTPRPINSTGIGKAEPGDTSSSHTTITVLAVLLALFVLIVILLIIGALLALKGMIHIKGRSIILGYGKSFGKSSDNTDSSAELNRTRYNSYSTPNDTCSDTRPQLPARKRMDQKLGNTNKSFSDIVSSDHGSNPEGITRDRSQSLPIDSHHTIGNLPIQQPISHMPENGTFPLLNRSPILDQSYAERLMQKEFPAVSPPVSATRDLDRPNLFQKPKQNNNCLPVYVNNTAVVNSLISFPQEEIIFQNVPCDSAVYKLTSPKRGIQNNVLDRYHLQTAYIPVQTPEGIAYIRAEDFQRMLQASSFFSENLSTHARGMSEMPDQNASQATVYPVASSSLLQNGAEVPMTSRDYITPIHVVYDKQHPVLNLGAKLSPEHCTQNHIADESVNAAVYNPKNSSGASKVSPASQGCDTYTIDSSNYMLPRHLAQAIAPMGDAQGNISKMSPVSVNQPPRSVLKTAARPDSLLVVPVYAQIKPRTPQYVTGTSDEDKHIPQENLSPDSHENKDVSYKTSLDDRDAYVTQTEQQMRTGDHHRPSQVRLAHVREELEEIV
ncbi:hypothetical protein BsWGS_12154 [Bradybaena similaris]